MTKGTAPFWGERTEKAPNGFFIRESRGAVFLLNYNNFVDRQIAFYGDWEAPQLTTFEHEMRKHGCDLFLDVGANIGYYSVLIAKLKLAHRIIAFEPDVRNRYQFEANILMNRVMDEINIVPRAVTSFTGSVKLIHFSEASTGQSYVSSSSDGVDVEAVCLNDLIKDDNILIFIKMDIEGGMNLRLSAACLRW